MFLQNLCSSFVCLRFYLVGRNFDPCGIPFVSFWTQQGNSRHLILYNTEKAHGERWGPYNQLTQSVNIQAISRHIQPTKNLRISLPNTDTLAEWLATPLTYHMSKDSQISRSLGYPIRVCLTLQPPSKSVLTLYSPLYIRVYFRVPLHQSLSYIRNKTKETPSSAYRPAC